MMETPSQMIPFLNCFIRKSTAGNIFWEIIKKNDYFECQSHKAQVKYLPIFFTIKKGGSGFVSVVSFVKGAWSHTSTHRFLPLFPLTGDRIMLKIQDQYYEVAIAPDEPAILSSWYTFQLWS
jgi:hypothetical protein